MKHLDFWFEFASTYSYPAAMRIEKLAAERGVKVRWHAFLLGPIFKAQGWRDSPFNLFPAKGNYMWHDMQRICQRYNLPFMKPSRFPLNGLQAARIACWYQDAKWLSAFVKAVFQANFVKDLNIADPAVLEQILNDLQLDAEAILTQAQSAESKARLQAANQQAVRLGIFGAPFFIAGQEPFWGQDQLELALDWCLHNEANLSSFG
ncbi:2-hydroxychromene-2-carboxylate isomerase [Bowmanella denitrificans]|uniref:2-hydroxychromene-2-carboxylate isomerase n=1 Tax=Bowmanella denitrificans TaxID=366582 RepID=UPI000C9CC667|nr:2-hydroxychromene-2-carboxylate isomerase [Bowmanella denitrificans]